MRFTTERSEKELPPTVSANFRVHATAASAIRAEVATADAAHASDVSSLLHAWCCINRCQCSEIKLADIAWRSDDRCFKN